MALDQMKSWRDSLGDGVGLEMAVLKVMMRLLVRLGWSERVSGREKLIEVIVSLNRPCCYCAQTVPAALLKRR